MLRKRSITIVLFGMLFAIVSFIALIVTEKEYKASMDFIVLQEQTDNQDLYSISRSIEYMINVLSGSIYSSSFIDKMIEEQSVSTRFTSLSKKKQMKEWSKALVVKDDMKSGIVRIELYGNTQYETEHMAQGFVDVFTEEKNIFGNNEIVTIKILSEPIIEQNPSSAKMLVVVVGGWMLGMGIMVIFIYYSEQLKVLNRDRKFGNFMDNKSNNSVDL